MIYSCSQRWSIQSRIPDFLRFGTAFVESIRIS
jgi:hypothetical protein